MVDVLSFGWGWRDEAHRGGAPLLPWVDSSWRSQTTAARSLALPVNHSAPRPLTWRTSPLTDNCLWDRDIHFFFFPLPISFAGKSERIKEEIMSVFLFGVIEGKGSWTIGEKGTSPGWFTAFNRLFACSTKKPFCRLRWPFCRKQRISQFSSRQSTDRSVFFPTALLYHTLPSCSTPQDAKPCTRNLEESRGLFSN